MKKLFVLIFAIILALALVGCSGDGTTGIAGNDGSVDAPISTDSTVSDTMNTPEIADFLWTLEWAYNAQCLDSISELFEPDVMQLLFYENESVLWLQIQMGEITLQQAMANLWGIASQDQFASVALQYDWHNTYTILSPLNYTIHGDEASLTYLATVKYFDDTIHYSFEETIQLVSSNNFWRIAVPNHEQIALDFSMEPGASDGLGIIVAEWRLGSHPNERITIISIDPNTGAHRTISNFTMPSEQFRGISSLRSPEDMQSLSENLDKLAVTMVVGTDNARHVGWVESNGGFFDVTELIVAPQGDFSEVIHHSDPRFGPDNYFYFVSSGNVFRVPLHDLTPEAVETVGEVQSFRGNHGYRVHSDGSVGNGALYNASMSYWLPHSSPILPSSVSGPSVHNSNRQWVDENTMLGVRATGRSGPGAGSLDNRESWEDTILPTLVFIDAIPTGTEARDVNLNERQRLVLPANSTRRTWDGVVSPCGTQIAFLSKSTSGASFPELFVASIDGEDIRRVDTEIAFWEFISNERGSRERHSIIAWR